jgi:hypothetical protein
MCSMFGLQIGPPGGGLYNKKAIGIEPNTGAIRCFIMVTLLTIYMVNIWWAYSP